MKETGDARPNDRHALADAELAAQVRRHQLPDEVAARLLRLLGLLADPLAPTAIHEPQDIVNDHLADSLVALDLPDARTASVIADIGSGSGLPGLVLSLCLPATRVLLVESSSQKCQFLERAVRACQAERATVVNARVEEWREGRGLCDVVTARAVAPLAVVAEYAAPLLRVGGSLVAWRGKRDEAAERAAECAAALLGLRVYPPVRVKPYPAASHRHLHVMRKIGETPPRFPRRPGIARKRPLGTS